jgi:sigma-B regulation protein RsbU (phosphoserine phosphatase)
MSRVEDFQLFKGVSRELVEQALAPCPRRHLPAGEILIRPGETNRFLYLLQSGELEARLNLDASHSGFPVAAGECVGEMSIIDGRPTSAYVRATEDSELLVVPEAVFWERIAPLQGVARNLLGLLSKRMRDRTDVMLRALEERLKYQHMEKELAAAGAIQIGMLPRQRPLFPRHAEVDAHAVMFPAKEVGGDLYDALALDDDHVLVAVGDVSGKGMPAALFMMRTLTLLRAEVGAGIEASELLPTLNRLLCENNDADMFVTLYVAILCVRDGRLALLNGGHNPPLLSRGGQRFELMEGAKGPLLGVMPGARFSAAETVLRPGDRLLLYTDGITEAENLRHEFFTTGRLLETVNAAGEGDLRRLVDSVISAVTTHANGAIQSDDITLLALHYRGAR